MKQPAMTEKDLSQHIVNAARECGWLVWHPWLSIHSARGYPDLTMVREMEDGTAILALAELKSEKGKLTEAQMEWLAVLRKVPGIDVFLWRPTDLEKVYKYLVDPKGVYLVEGPPGIPTWGSTTL